MRTRFKLRPYQSEAVRLIQLIWKRGWGAYLADQMGLGKTTVSVALMNLLFKWNSKILIICPALAIDVWLNEMREKRKSFNLVHDQVIDSSAQDVSGDTVITSFNLASDELIHEQLSNVEWDLIIIDEFHYLKNPEAERTKKILGPEKKIGGLWACAEKRLALSGSPFPNNGSEGYTAVKSCIPGVFKGNYKTFCHLFAGYVENHFGKKLRGHGNRNVERLQKLIGKFMVRRLKKDVLHDLPDKLPTQEIHLTRIRSREIKKLIKEESAYTFEDFTRAVPKLSEAIAASEGDPFERAPLATIRLNLGIAKVPFAVSLLEEDILSVNKIIVFTFHRDVAIETHRRLKKYNPVLCIGGINRREREQARDTFQNDPECRFFVATIKAAGVALTLTAASDVFFIEPWYVPADIDQAIDRAHRFGQKDVVSSKVLLLPDTLDQDIWDRAKSKEDDLNEILSGIERKH